MKRRTAFVNIDPAKRRAEIRARFDEAQAEFDLDPKLVDMFVDAAEAQNLELETAIKSDQSRLDTRKRLRRP